jgi:hypothetical protein
VRVREVFEVVLCGLTQGQDLDDIAPEVAAYASERSLFPGDVLLVLAADIIEVSGATRAHPIDTEQIRRRLLPEDRAHNRAQHYKAEYAIRAAAMIRAGVDPALIDNAGAWRMNDLWLWSLEAVVVYARAAADYAGITVADICTRVAGLHSIAL